LSLQQIAARLHLPSARYKVDRRKSFRVDPEFQNRFRLRILGLALTISLVGALASVGVALTVRLPAFSHDRILQIVAAGLALVEGLLIVLLCDRFSHRYCGPVYRIKQALEAVRRGERPDPVRVRRNDEFVDLAALLNDVLAKLGALDGPAEDRSTSPPG